MLLSGSDRNSLEYMPRGKVSDTARLIELVVLREPGGFTKHRPSCGTLPTIHGRDFQPLATDKETEAPLSRAK